jgi:hypothetical protein
MKNAKKNMKRGLYQDLSKPCLTITSHLAKTSLNSRDPVLLVNPEKELYRRFTPREAASIQSFPDNFIFPVSDTQAYRQIGNAIPPVLMWHVMKSLSESINRKEKPTLKSHTHLQFSTANATPKIEKEYVSRTLNSELNNKHQKNKLNEKSTTYNTV